MKEIYPLLSNSGNSATKRQKEARFTLAINKQQKQQQKLLNPFFFFFFFFFPNRNTTSMSLNTDSVYSCVCVCSIRFDSAGSVWLGLSVLMIHSGYNSLKHRSGIRLGNELLFSAPEILKAGFSFQC